MRIGVTGGTGFVGNYFIDLFSDCNDIIVSSRNKDLAHAQHPTNSNVKYVYSDYSVDSIKEIFQGCEAVVHLGSTVHKKIDYSEKISKYFDNIVVTENILDACRLLEINNIVLTSSVAVYAQDQQSPIDECSICNPSSYYGISKLAVEKLAQLFSQRYGLNIKIFRLAHVLGINKHKPLDADNFFDKLLIQSVNGGIIPVYGKGITSRDIIYVKDVAHAILCGIKKPLLSGIFNIGIGKPISNSKLAETYVDVFGKGTIEYMPDKAETGYSTYMNCTKSKELLDFSPNFNLVSAVVDMKKEFDSHRDLPRK